MSINIQKNQWLKTTVVLCSFLWGFSLSAAEAIQSLDLTPTKLSFKASDKKTATLKTTGTTEVTITSIKITGTNKGEFTFSTAPDKNCGGKLAGGKDCTITITFSPDLKAAGARTAALEVVAADDPKFAYKVDLTGTAGTATPTDAAGPTVDLKPNPVDFGNQPVKTPSKEKIVTLTNTGQADLLKISLKITGDNSKDFAFTTDPADISVAPPKYTCGGTLAPKAKCQIKITCTPAAAGARKATLEVTSNAKSSPDKVDLTGTGTEAVQAATATLTPAAVDFKTQAVKTPSAEKTVTLKNTGKTDLTKLSVNITGDKDFTTTNDCGTTLAAGKTCQIKISLTPKTAGDKKATVEVKSDKTSLDKAELTGTGTEVAQSTTATLTPAAVDFKNQAVNKPSAAKSVTLKNTSKTDLTKLSISITGDKDYTTTNDCGTTLAAGKTCKINISLTPKTAGDKTATLEAKSDKTSLGKVELTGIGGDSTPTTTAGKVTADPAKPDFGNVIVKTSTNKTVTLTNSGKDDVKDLQITLADATGEFTTTSTSSTCGSTLGAGKSCAVEITFMPKSVEKREATLNVASGKTSLVKVPLMGMGVEYPSLKALAIDLTATGGNPVETTVKINGGVSLADPIDFKSSLTVKKNQPIIISAMISSLPEQDIGKEIDIIAIGYYVREPDLKKADAPSAENCDPSLVTNVEQGGYYIVKNDNPQDYCDWIVDGGAEGGWCVDHKTRDKEQATKHYVEKWDKNLATLEPLYTVVPDENGSLILSEQNKMVMYQGTIDGTGHVCVYMGYRTLAEGEGTPVFLIFNEDPLMIRVTD
ncbi:hypothetical protein THII_3545 [Thioploca ingrica]|uniref:Abnormal spindle-like microcephaly-associated protein ASH domain-containing protein n=1 Tax=Thioploca ingrica TaxID=40754 RepID=A0A090ANU8_9GAMM|nr:hypothetical protein THII_3545 [Thioploca ingrica]